MKRQLYKRSSNALFAQVADDFVALHVERGHSYGMEKVTAAVWRLLEEPADVDAICGELMRRYDVDEETCRGDVERLIRQLEEEGLVEPVAPRDG